MKLHLLTLLFIIIPQVLTQKAGTQVPEGHPPLTWHQCKKDGHCSQVHGAITLDAAWRWSHDGSLEGIERPQYQSTYGVIASGDSLRMNFITPHKVGKNVGSRVYLMANESKYQMFHVLGQEFTFDVDTGKLPCALNGALYLTAMEADGGMARDQNNKAGAKYGTGYCDGQCQGVRCCNEFDLWEANSAATTMTAHPCSGATCDHDGCLYDPYQTDKNFYGPGKTVDSNKVITVVTQFITNDGTDRGQLVEIRRLYVQGGKVIGKTSTATNTINQAFCGGRGDFNSHGGLKTLGEALHSGMALIFALWDDKNGDMKWLDTGVNGPCPTEHIDVETKYPNAYVVWSKIRVGPIGSTYKHH